MTETQPGRDTSGRFTDGNPGGPGRPRRATEHDYLAVLSEACSLADWREIVEKAVVRAKQGDAKACEWLASYLVGQPRHEARTLTQLAVDALNERDPIAAAARIAAADDQFTDLLSSLS